MLRRYDSDGNDFENLNTSVLFSRPASTRKAAVKRGSTAAACEIGAVPF